MDYNYIKRFQNLGYGLFIHFGLYSTIGKGEWWREVGLNVDKAKYDALISKFNVKKTWARDLVKFAKKAGAKYITLTTRHHDGFSLYDTCGLNDFDAPHSASHRDLVREFVDECNKAGIVPFFYHTLLDWHVSSYNDDFDAYLDYLYKSVEILCKNYGKIGGLWFDGFWNKPKADWKFDRLYKMIKSYQPEAMIINNTGLSERGKVSHPLIDSVTFERGNPTYIDNTDRPRASEMCETINDHWGYSKKDISYKPVSRLIDTLLICRKCNSNFLLNIGPKGNGSLPPVEKYTVLALGDFIKYNKNFVYDVKGSDVEAENGYVLQDDKHYYAVVNNVKMSVDVNVSLYSAPKSIIIKTDKKIVNAKYLDDNHKATVEGNSIAIDPFPYGTGLCTRIIKFDLK